METWEGRWPYEGVVVISLCLPSPPPIRRSSPNLEFREVGDPRYWKAEYYSAAANQMLLCGSGEHPVPSDSSSQFFRCLARSTKPVMMRQVR